MRAREKNKVILIRRGGRCPDCDLRNALDPVGLPRVSKRYGHLLTYGCMGCRGTGVEITEEINVTEWLGKLTAKQRFVLELRHGLRGGATHTQEEVAELMGITQSAVGRIEARAETSLWRRWDKEKNLGALPSFSD